MDLLHKLDGPDQWWFAPLIWGLPVGVDCLGPGLFCHGRLGPDTLMLAGASHADEKIALICSDAKGKDDYSLSIDLDRKLASFHMSDPARR